MAKVLVTGATGFIGWHLVETLATRGDEVSCLVRKTSEVDRLRSLDVRLVYGDVTDPNSLKEAIAENRIVYHLAGLTLALKTAQFYAINQQGVRHVAEVCAEQPTPPVLVTVSSLAAAGPAVDGRPRTEADPPAPVSHYGRSKRAGELAAEQFADRVPTTVVRPPIVLGEADRAGLEMFRMINRLGVRLVSALGRNRFSLIHAADLTDALIRAARRGKRLKPGGADDRSPPQGYYFVADDEQPTYADLGRMIAAALGRRRVLVIPSPPRTIWFVATANELVGRIRRRPLYLNFDKTREIRAGSWLCSSQTAKEELGFSAAACLADRLRQTAQWYRQKGWI